MREKGLAVLGDVSWIPEEGSGAGVLGGSGSLSLMMTDDLGLGKAS